MNEDVENQTGPVISCVVWEYTQNQTGPVISYEVLKYTLIFNS